MNGHGHRYTVYPLGEIELHAYTITIKIVMMASLHLPGGDFGLPDFSHGTRGLGDFLHNRVHEAGPVPGETDTNR